MLLLLLLMRVAAIVIRPCILLVVVAISIPLPVLDLPLLFTEFENNFLFVILNQSISSNRSIDGMACIGIQIDSVEAVVYACMQP